jgi:hypothetical protein
MKDECVRGGEAEMLVTNTVEREGPPYGFVYSTQRKMIVDSGAAIEIDDGELKCECDGRGCRRSDRCCPQLNDSTFAYDEFGRLRDDHRGPIFECSKL